MARVSGGRCGGKRAAPHSRARRATRAASVWVTEWIRRARVKIAQDRASSRWPSRRRLEARLGIGSTAGVVPQMVEDVMKSRIQFGVCALGLIALSALLAFGCTNDPPTAPNSFYILNQNTNNNGTPASPSPGESGTLPPGSTVRIEIFGASCPTGANPRPNPGQLKAGCSLALTCTPKGPDGINLTPAVHGPVALWSVPIGSGYLALVQESEAFNATAFATAVGVAQVSCSVKGTVGSLALTVVP